VNFDWSLGEALWSMHHPPLIVCLHGFDFYPDPELPFGFGSTPLELEDGTRHRGRPERERTD
jgi:hypothetical protein